MNKSILVVEDNKDHSQLIKKILSRYGYTIVITETGKETLDYCTSHSPPDLILMDIFLPDINGIELTKQIKKLSPFSKTPIVAVTVHAEKHVEVQIIEAGCINILFKPYQPPELVKIVEEYLVK
jgi:CheY-like chemotaxis protein